MRAGHHGTVHFGPYRVVMDESGGLTKGRLGAVALPQLITVDHKGRVEQHDASQVFA